LNFKIDEILPVECAHLLRDAGFGAHTVAEENLAGADDKAIARTVQAEGRVLVTLDLDFSNIRAYPPSTLSGIIVLRLKRQDKRGVLRLMNGVVAALKTRLPEGDLWIVEPDRIRFRAR
jgi:predicted nuclease of predicted toxin-antitoxin system